MKKIVSLFLVFCMLISFCLAVSAAETDTNILTSEVADRIEQIVSASFSTSPGQYDIDDFFAIYNADTSCVYFIIPIFHGQECVGMVEVDVSGSVTMTNDGTLYNNIIELPAAEYVLFTSGGIVYAELPGVTVELYDSGFEFPLNSEFMSLSYTDKVELAETCLETATTSFDVLAVIEEVEIPYITAPELSLFALGGIVTESESCSITNFVEQGNYNICWAACVATIVNYKNGRALTAADVAAEMGHNYTLPGYTGASLEDTISALSFYSLTYNATSAKLSWTGVKDNIKNNRPFIVGIESSGGRHMLTGYGYSCHIGDDDTYSNSRYVYVWDPNGAKRTFQYNASSYSLYGYSWSWIETLID